MKNLKKVLALVLVVATLMGFATVAGAQFTDDSSVTYKEAVEVMAAIDVINGYTDGTFRPTANVTRAQMAKMVAYILASGDDVGDLYAGANTFSDCTTHWAKGYIAYASKTGIIAGVGGILTFLPNIFILFLALAFLEDSGYMARIAFVMDKLLRKIGLSGRSIVPMLIGFGCTVPGVMAARTLPSARDRRMTIMLTPFMSCTAKLPIYGFFTAAFFPGKGALIMVALYFTGIIIGILAALVSKGFMFRGEAVPFVMELPNYRMPGRKM